MILRGIFSATHDTIDLFGGEELDDHILRARNHALGLIPKDSTMSPIEYYLHKMTSGTEEEKKTFAYELELYGAILNFPTLPIDKIKADLSKRDYFPHAIIIAHYAHHRFFLDDGYIWDNLAAIKDIPMDIVHGKYDLLCPVQNAYRLHEEMDDSDLYIVDGGHSSLDPAIDKKLKEIMSTIK